MLQATTLIGLFLVMCVYGISLIGIRRYEIITTIKMLRKKEILGLVLCIGMVFLGILMQASRYSMEMDGGLITSSIVNVASLFFVDNTSITTLAVLLVTIIPAYMFQVFAILKIVARLKISYAQIFFYVVIYALNIGLYSKMVFSAGQAVIYLLFSAFLYYLIMILSKVRGKKDYMYILGYIGLLFILICFEKSIDLPIIMLSMLTIVESVVMALYLGKSIILRRTLRKVGVLVLLLGFVWVNSIL